ncbi:tail fiber protein [Escherichia coli]|uniref:tail fiber protein n=3 Tax=Escherichia coli TaxID=562 RepID=UPI0030F46B2A
MSVVVSGTLKTPDGAVVSGANITLTALTVSPDALSGTSASAVTTASGYYGMTMEPGEYAVSVSVKGKTSVYGRIRIEGTESSVTLNMLLRRSLVEVSIPDELLVGFRQIQNNVADDLATIRRLNEDSAEKNRQSIQAKDIAVESARHAEESETRIRELALQAQASEHEAGRQAGIATDAADTSGENARRAEHAMAATEGIAADTANEVARRISQEVKDNARRAEDGATNAEHYASVSKAGAERAETSERKTAELADDVSVSLQQTLAATHDVQEARDIAIQKAGEVAAGMADVQENALKISQSLQDVTLARDAAVRAREGAESALAATVQQAGIATQQAEEAGNAVKQATRQAELTATARNEAVSAKDETAAFAREVAESVSQINQKVTTATGAAERAEKAADTTTTNAGQAAASAGNAAKDREATQILTQRAETAAGRAEEIAGAFNLEDASPEKKGIVRLSSATDSDSETEAATPKAVKEAYDLAKSRASSDHSHSWEQITNVAGASLTEKGVVQLSSATDSDSETEAATPKAVKKAIEIAGQKYTAQDATTEQKGIVQLSSATDSDSETEAATSKAVRAAYDLANGKYTAQDAMTSRKGLVQLSSATNSNSETEAATPKAVKAAYDLANGKAPSVHTHAWNQVAGVPAASLTARGITQLSSATNSVSETLAATPRAVKAVMDETGRKAPLNSPALTGTPTAPTAEQSVNNTQIATTAFVKAAIAAMVASAPAALDTLNELAAALGNDPKFATTMLNALAGKQPLNEQLTAFSQLAGTPDTLPYFDSKRQLSLANISEAARTLLAMTTKEAMQQHLGVGNNTLSKEELLPIILSLFNASIRGVGVGTIILAALVGTPSESRRGFQLVQGREYSGAEITPVSLLMDAQYNANIKADTIANIRMPGVFMALSGYGASGDGGVVGLFIRIR